MIEKQSEKIEINKVEIDKSRKMEIDEPENMEVKPTNRTRSCHVSEKKSSMIDYSNKSQVNPKSTSYTSLSNTSNINDEKALLVGLTDNMPLISMYLII